MSNFLSGASDFQKIALALSAFGGEGGNTLNLLNALNQMKRQEKQDAALSDYTKNPNDYTGQPVTAVNPILGRVDPTAREKPTKNLLSALSGTDLGDKLAMSQIEKNLLSAPAPVKLAKDEVLYQPAGMVSASSITAPPGSATARMLTAQPAGAMVARPGGVIASNMQGPDTPADKVGIPKGTPEWKEFNQRAGIKETYVEGLDPNVVRGRQIQQAKDLAELNAMPVKNQAAADELARKQAADAASFNQTDYSFQRIQDTARAIRNNPALANVTGPVAGRTPNMTDAARSLQADINNLKSQLVLGAMNSARQGSANGSTGFGALSEKELGVLEKEVADLDQAQGTKDYQSKLDKVVAHANRIQNILRQSRGVEPAALPTGGSGGWGAGETKVIGRAKVTLEK